MNQSLVTQHDQQLDIGSLYHFEMLNMYMMYSFKEGDYVKNYATDDSHAHAYVCIIVAN